jgi:hypothetical protein
VQNSRNKNDYLSSYGQVFNTSNMIQAQDKKLNITGINHLNSLKEVRASYFKLQSNPISLKTPDLPENPQLIHTNSYEKPLVGEGNKLKSQITRELKKANQITDYSLIEKAKKRNFLSQEVHSDPISQS